MGFYSLVLSGMHSLAPLELGRVRAARILRLGPIGECPLHLALGQYSIHFILLQSGLLRQRIRVNVKAIVTRLFGFDISFDEPGG